MKYQPNRIKIDVASYRHYWRGIPKVGKTTMFRDLIIEAYGDPRFGLLISPGNESGFRALDNIYAVETPTWMEFVNTVSDLVENKEDNEFKLIGIDTVDELISIASDHTLNVHFQRKNERVNSLNAALGGYGAGHVYVAEIVNDQLKKLESAGYGLIFIGHTKIKDIKEKNLDEPYQQLTSNLESRFDRIFMDKADVVATFYVSKDIKDKELVGTERFIYFRNDGFVDAGSRFSNMPERVPMTAKNYIQAFEQGVKSSFVNPVSDKDIEKMKKEEVAKKEKEATAFSEKEKNVILEDEKLETPEDYKTCIGKKLVELDEETKKQKRAEIKSAGLPADYKSYQNIDDLKKFLKIIVSK